MDCEYEGTIFNKIYLLRNEMLPGKFALRKDNL
jgi:hypothetical protein